MYSRTTQVNNVSRLNLQLKQIYDLLKQIDNFQIPLEMINPDIKDSITSVPSSSILGNPQHNIKDCENHVYKSNYNSNDSQTSTESRFSSQSIPNASTQSNSQTTEEIHKSHSKINTISSTSITEVLYRGEHKNRLIANKNGPILYSHEINNSLDNINSISTVGNENVEFGTYVGGRWHLLDELNGNEHLISQMTEQELIEYQKL